jgi:hypothetical protein
MTTELDDILSQLTGPQPEWKHFHDDRRKLAIAKLYLLREQIAAVLGGTIVQPENDYERHTVIDMDGISVTVNPNGKPDRLKIGTHKLIGRGCDNWWYNACKAIERDGKTPVTDISVTASKSPDAIAKDIQRRLLPDAWDIVKRAETLMAEHNRDLAAMDAFATRFMAAMPGSTVSQSTTSNPHERTMWVPGMRECRLYCCDGRETIGLTVSGVPADAAIAFLQSLAK